VNGARSRRGVLLLQGRWAYWSLWQGNHCLEHRQVGLSPGSIAVSPDDDEVRPELICPWAGRRDTLIDVIVDSPLDEIDRVFTVSDHWPRPFGALGRRLLHWRLGWRHPEAAVRLALRSGYATPEKTDASAAPSILGALLRCGIPDLWQQRLEMLQSGPVTIRRVHSAIRVDAGPADRGPVLQIACGHEHERHTLFMGGCPVFTRVVEPGDEAESAAALIESRAHVSRLHGIPLVEVVRIDDDDGRRLARLAVQGRHEPVQAALLEPFRERVEQRRLLALTGATTLIAGVAVVIAVVHGVDSARQRARATAAGEVLESRLTRLGERLEAAHDDPPLAVETLALFDAHAAGGAPAAAAILRGLADVLVAHPSIAIDRLAWHTRNGDHTVGEHSMDIDEGLAEWSGRAADLPPRAMTGGRTGAVEDVAGGAFALQFSGHVRSLVVTIGDRQRRFEAFVEALGERTRPLGLRVELSPATAASNGEPATGVQPIDYELRLLYTKAG